MARSRDFNFAALYAALEARRQERGLSWSAATREINGGRPSGGVHALSPSTVVATRSRRVMEGDGVLQMLRWLDRAPEAFLGESCPFAGNDARLPEVPAGHVLRFDTRKIHSALEARRRERKMSWREVGREIGVAESGLTRLSRGSRTSFPQVMWIVGWLGEPAARFTRIADH